MPNRDSNKQLHSKSHQINNLADAFGMTRRQAAEILEFVMGDIEGAIMESKEVRIPGVGTLYVKDVAERKRMNPHSKELYVYPAHKRIALRPSKPGIARLNGE